MARIERFKLQAESYYIRKRQGQERKNMNYETTWDGTGSGYITITTPNTPITGGGWTGTGTGANNNGLIAALCLVLGMHTKDQRAAFATQANIVLNTTNASVETLYDKLVRVGYAVKEQYPDDE